jgi:hypothetical protein
VFLADRRTCSVIKSSLGPLMTFRDVTSQVYTDMMHVAERANQLMRQLER